MNEHEILDLICEAADAIADYHGMNVPYCESMDMSLFHQPVLAMLDDEEEGEPDLDDLQYLAQNNRLLPESLSNASLDEFKAYCKEHKDKILGEIQSVCEEYINAYGNDGDEDEDDEEYSGFCDE